MQASISVTIPSGASSGANLTAISLSGRATRRGRLHPVLLALALLAGPVALRAQIPIDSVLPDTLPRDSISETTRFLNAQKNARIRLNTMPLLGVDGPRTPLSRFVFTRDSIEWTNAETVSDLLQRVPGVFLWRGGWLGRTEYPAYQGRGATSVEYQLDGFPYIPIGPDSVGVDPSMLALSLLDRIEIERWPGLLRVQLFTRRHDRRAPRSVIGIASGDRRIARYEGSLEYRFQSGIGFGLGGDYLNSPTPASASSAAEVTNYWLQGSYIPSANFGVQFDVLRVEPNRRPFVDSQLDTLDGGLKGSRSDAQLRLFMHPVGGATGPRVDLLYGRTSWSGSGVTNEVNQGGLALSFRRPTYSIGGSALNRSRWTPFDVRGEAGWTPVAGVSASGEIGLQTHDYHRRSSWIGLRGGLQLPLSLVVSAAVRSGQVVAAPSIPTDAAQRIRDVQVAAGWQRPRLGFEVSLSRTDAFRPIGFQPFLRIDSIGPASAANWVTFNWRVAPRSWLTLEGWYSDPTSGSAEGNPPTHSLSTATIRSKFWRSFPSGTFDFKLQGSIEAWSPGVIGRDATGAPVTVDGATYFRSLIEIQLQSFSIFWDRYNLDGTGKPFVPGFEIPRAGTFGVRWTFTN
ncbi:MAG: Plug domain-containing protein [Gemmatimonadota bacterium]